MWELGKVEGAETLAAAMRTAYALGTKAKEHAQNIRHTQHRGGIGLSSTNPFAAQSSSILHAMETQNGRSMVCCLRHVLSEQLPNDVAAVVRVIAPEGSRVQLNASAPTGKQERN